MGDNNNHGNKNIEKKNSSNNNVMHSNGICKPTEACFKVAFCRRLPKGAGEAGTEACDEGARKAEAEVRAVELDVNSTPIVVFWSIF